MYMYMHSPSPLHTHTQSEYEGYLDTTDKMARHNTKYIAIKAVYSTYDDHNENTDQNKPKWLYICGRMKRGWKVERYSAHMHTFLCAQ